MTDDANRRVIKAREQSWAKRLAAHLADGGVSADTISLMGLAFAFMGGAAFALSGLMFGWGRVALLVIALIAIPCRLLCNMLDGMIAVEHKKGSPAGPIWNELPDRIADALLLAGAGYGAMAAHITFGPTLGWLCALFAVMTAYVRELGHGMGFAADFSGPLAKPQRMGLLIAATAMSLFEEMWDGRGWSLLVGLGLIAILTGVTIVKRTMRLAKALRERAAG